MEVFLHNTKWLPALCKNAQSRMDFLNKLNIALKEADEVTEQRAQSLTRLSYVESRRNSTIVKQNTGWIYSMRPNFLMIICMIRF